MKTGKVIGSLSFTMALTTICGLAWAGLEGSKHDFSNKPWSGGDRCGVCHSPHRDVLPKATPLWDPKADLSRTFGTPLTQNTLAGSGTTICLRCHDGTMARDRIGGATRTRFASRQHPGLFQAGHARSDHPVGVAYPAFDKRFHSPTHVVAKGRVVLPAGRVECISCHDPHNTAGTIRMLVMNNARSALCLTCHKK